MSRVVITDCDHPGIAFEAAVLGAAGVELRLEQCRSEAEVAARCGDADALLVQYAPISGRAIAGLPRCRAVVRYGVGYDTLDVPALTEAGIWACNVPDYCVAEVAGQAVALLLALNRGLVPLANATAAGAWDFTIARPVVRLTGQTLGIIGFGRIGRATAARAAPFGLRLLAHDPYVPDEQVLAAGATPVGFDEVLAVSDYLSLHLPLSDRTRHLIDAAALARMRPSAYLINTARGGLVDEAALAAALREGRLTGAGLDVLEAEPPPAGHPLLGLPNCLVLPHSAWYSEQSMVELKTKAAEEALRSLRGERPHYALNPDVQLRGMPTRP